MAETSAPFITMDALLAHWQGHRRPRPREELPRLWDESTAQDRRTLAAIPPERFQETLTAFGQFTGWGHSLFLYVIDNEIHHRGQGYVYLRALGLAPPPFYERN